MKIIKIKEEFIRIPEAMQKEIAVRFGLSCIFTIISIILIVGFGDVFIFVMCVLLSGFMIVNGIWLFVVAKNRRYVVVTGICDYIEYKRIRFFNRRVKSIHIVTEQQSVKIMPTRRIKGLSEGKLITVYISQKSPVYEYDGEYVVCSYIAITKGEYCDGRKGKNVKCSGKHKRNNRSK